jgi:hypothetical protein
MGLCCVDIDRNCARQFSSDKLRVSLVSPIHCSFWVYFVQKRKKGALQLVLLQVSCTSLHVDPNPVGMEFADVKITEGSEQKHDEFGWRAGTIIIGNPKEILNVQLLGTQ